MNGISREKIEELVCEYRESLISFIYRYVRDLHTAEDLAEDVFVEILLHPDRFRNASSEKTYLYAIGRNKAVDYIRKHSRLLLVGGGDSDNPEEGRAFMERALGEEERIRRMAEDSDPASQVIKNEEISSLRKALGEIKKEYREALVLVYFEDMSYEETGRVLGKNTKQVENLIYRGKKSLAKVMESNITKRKDK